MQGLCCGTQQHEIALFAGDHELRESCIAGFDDPDCLRIGPPPIYVLDYS
jgi:hypothetical protein